MSILCVNACKMLNVEQVLDMCYDMIYDYSFKHS